MKRIKSFTIGSHVVNVKYQKKVLNPDSREEVLGLFVPLKNLIIISTNYRDEDLCEDVIWQSLHHEVCHVFMMTMNMWELNNDEPFIDVLGLLLAQFNKSKK